MKATLPARVRFAEFELELKTGELRGGGHAVRLTEKPFRVLMILVEHSGELVTREEIQKKLWPNDTIVDFEHGINSAIKVLRRALGESVDQPKYIETFARRGYRLMVPVEWVTPAADESSSGEVSSGGAGLAAHAQLARVGLIGKKVSHYRVLEVAGGGGMGLVYKAEDLKLGRRVALKFLPEELATDALTLQRFEREARTASSLNHPNICTIYEVEEHEAQPFIVMELLEGETLRDRLAAASTGVKPISLAELLDIAIPIAEGLRSAHDNGIVHRDIKPANIFLTAQGQVKILDFGLAKLADIERDTSDELARPSPKDGLERGTLGAEEESVEERRAHPLAPSSEKGGAPAPQMELTLTRTGTAMGTAGYMSPEQARGEKLDARTDLFSFGLVLYEMATGQRAFIGDTAAILKDAILNRTPAPVHEFNSTLPPQVEQIITRSLEKDRERRYQSAAEIRAELRAVKPDAKPIADQPSTRRGWKPLAGVATVLGIALVAVGWLLYSQRHQPKMRNPLQQMSVERLTSDRNTSGAASISPDGKYVVYESSREGKLSLWLRQVATSSAVRLVPDSEDWFFGTTFSPDGNFVYYVQVNKDSPNGGLYVVPTLGGTPRKILANVDSPVTLSPDGKQIAYVSGTLTNGSISQLLVANADGSNPRPLYVANPPALSFDKNGPSWSPDGKRIAVGTMSSEQAGTSTGIAMVALSGEMTTLVPKLSGRVARLQWLHDGSGLVYCATANFGGTTSGNFQQGEQLWFVSYPQGEVSRITNDLNSYGNASLGVTADDSTLVTTQKTVRSEIWRVSSDLRSVKQITSGPEDGWFSVAAAAGKIAYSSRPTAHRSLWVADSDGYKPVQVIPEGDQAGTFAFSPDGRSIAYVAVAKAIKLDLRIMNSDGSNARQLTTTGWNRTPNFSADGQWVYYTHQSEGKNHLFKLSIAGGEPVQVSDLHVLISSDSISHRGDRMVVWYFDEKTSQWQLGIMSLENGKVSQTLERSLPGTLSPGSMPLPAWAPADDALLFLETHNGVSNIWKLPLNGGPPRQLTHFTSDIIWSFAVGPDGSLFLGRGNIESDAILIHNFQ